MVRQSSKLNIIDRRVLVCMQQKWPGYMRLVSPRPHMMTRREARNDSCRLHGPTFKTPPHAPSLRQRSSNSLRVSFTSGRSRVTIGVAYADGAVELEAFGIRTEDGGRVATEVSSSFTAPCLTYKLAPAGRVGHL